MVVHLAERGVELVLFAPRPLTAEQLDHPNIQLVTSNLNGRIGNVVWSKFVLPYAINKHKVDVFWGPAHRLPSRLWHVPKVLTVHDLVWKKHPETMSRLGLLGEKLLMPGALKRADRIVCLSQYTLDDLLSDDPKLEAIAQKIYPGTTEQVPDSGAGVSIADQAYMLFVGTQEPRKNLENLLRSYAALSHAQKDKCHLKIIGAAGWKQSHLRALTSELSLSHHVHWCGFVDDVELERSYQGAMFQVLPSIFEGFGLPIIEAQKYSKPVLTSNCSSMPEILGEGGLLVDPNDVPSITTGLARLIDDAELRTELGRKAKLNVARFDWKASAKGFEELCEELLVSKRREF